jgi:ATP-binding cassette subfamily B protein
MKEVLRGLRLMLSISLGADAARTVAALVTASGQTLASPFRALALKGLIDGAAAHDGRRALIGAAALAVVSLVGRLMTWASFNVRMRLRENTQLHLDTHLMALTAGIPGLEHHERPDYLDKVELVRSERESLANPFNPISWTFAAVAQNVSAVALLFAVHPLLALLPLFGLPTLLARFGNEKAQADLRERQSGPGRVRRHLFELVTSAAAAKEVRIFGLAPELAGRRRRLTRELERDRRAVARRGHVLDVVGSLVFAAGYLAALLLVVHLAAGGRASLGAVVLVMGLGAQVNGQVEALADQIAWTVHTHRAVVRFLWLTDYARDRAAALTPGRPAAAPDRLQRGITLRDVSFTYPGTERPVLEKVDLFLPAGSTVAIVGSNGAGKTTLVKLLCRFYEPSSGAILLDDLALRDVPVAEWRARVASGFQDFARLSLLAREAVGVGDAPRIDADAEVLGALERAAAAELPAAFPRGLDTQLGRDFEGGIELSQGQWQKLALARAMMRTAPLLLVLDEPTASLDAATEHELFERFAGAARAGAARSAITVLVSHRFSTVRMADLILVVDGGRIAEAGDHAALMSTGGLYAELYQLQARGYR